VSLEQGPWNTGTAGMGRGGWVEGEERGVKTKTCPRLQSACLEELKGGNFVNSDRMFFGLDRSEDALGKTPGGSLPVSSARRQISPPLFSQAMYRKHTKYACADIIIQILWNRALRPPDRST